MRQVKKVSNRMGIRDARAFRKSLPVILDAISKRFTEQHREEIIRQGKAGAELSEKLT